MMVERQDQRQNQRQIKTVQVAFMPFLSLSFFDVDVVSTTTKNTTKKSKRSSSSSFLQFLVKLFH